VAEGDPQTITGLPIGDVCVVEEDVSTLPTGALPPVYSPATANTDGVTIGAGTTVSVGISNDLSAVGANEVVKPPVTPAAAVAAAPAFTG